MKSRYALLAIALLLVVVTLNAVPNWPQPMNFLYAQGVRIKQAFLVDSAATATFNNTATTFNGLTVFNADLTANADLTFGSLGSSTVRTQTMQTNTNLLIMKPGSVDIGPTGSAATSAGVLTLRRADGTNKILSALALAMNAAIGTSDCQGKGALVWRPGTTTGSVASLFAQCDNTGANPVAFLKVGDDLGAATASTSLNVGSGTTFTQMKDWGTATNPGTTVNAGTVKHVIYTIDSGIASGAPVICNISGGNWANDDLAMDGCGAAGSGQLVVMISNHNLVTNVATTGYDITYTVLKH